MSLEGKNTVESPCISVCLLSEEDICLGCYRNVAEIAGWHNLSNDQRREVVIIAEARRKADSTVFLN